MLRKACLANARKPVAFVLAGLGFIIFLAFVALVSRAETKYRIPPANVAVGVPVVYE